MTGNTIAIAAVPAFFLVLSGVMLLFQFGARRVYGYTLSPSALEIRLFGHFPIYRIAVEDIAENYPWRFSWTPRPALFTTLRLGNRIFGPAIVIERKASFPRYIVITPDDAATMSKQLDALTYRTKRP